MAKFNQGTPALVTFGLGGHTIHYRSVRMSEHSTSKATLSGYDDPARFEADLTADLEGVLVIDMRAAVGTDEGFRMVFSGPMCDVDLPPDGHNPFGEEDRNVAAGLLGPGGLEGGFATLAILAQDRKYCGLDYVGVGVFCDMWRKAGARIGRVEGGRIVWDR